MYGEAIEGLDSNYYEVEKNRISELKNLIEPFKKDFDFILIDIPPTMSDFTRNAAFASDYIIMAFQTQSDSLDGVMDYLEYELKPLVETFDSNTDVVGILPNQLSKGSIDSTVINDAKETFGEQNLFENIIPFVKRVQSTPRTGLTRESYWDNLAYEEVFLPLTNEFLKRIKMFEGEN